MRRWGIFMLGGLWLLVACSGASHTSSPPYTPQIRSVTMVTVPLLVNETSKTFGFLPKDFARGGVLSGKEVNAFSPDSLTAYQGDRFNITIVNPENDPHTFVLAAFHVHPFCPHKPQPMCSSPPSG